MRDKNRAWNVATIFAVDLLRDNNTITTAHIKGVKRFTPFYAIDIVESILIG